MDHPLIHPVVELESRGGLDVRACSLRFRQEPARTRSPYLPLVGVKKTGVWQPPNPIRDVAHPIPALVRLISAKPAPHDKTITEIHVVCLPPGSRRHTDINDRPGSDPDWGATRFFQYNIEATEVRVDATTGQRSISVLFSVTDPTQGQLPWDIKTNPMFRQPAGVSRLGLLVGWDNADYHNTGATRPDLAPVAFGNGIGAALPISVDLVRDAIPVGGRMS